MFNSSGDGVLDVVFQDSLAYLVERGAYSCDLCQHIVTLAPLFPQPLKAIGMTGDAGEPFGDVLA